MSSRELQIESLFKYWWTAILPRLITLVVRFTICIVLYNESSKILFEPYFGFYKNSRKCFLQKCFCKHLSSRVLNLRTTFFTFNTLLVLWKLSCCFSPLSVKSCFLTIEVSSYIKQCCNSFVFDAYNCCRRRDNGDGGSFDDSVNNFCTQRAPWTALSSFHYVWFFGYTASFHPVCIAYFSN